MVYVWFECLHMCGVALWGWCAWYEKDFDTFSTFSVHAMGLHPRYGSGTWRRGRTLGNGARLSQVPVALRLVVGMRTWHQTSRLPIRVVCVSVVVVVYGWCGWLSVVVCLLV